MYTDYFTFLNFKLSLSFDYGTIEPVEDFDKVRDALHAKAYEGYIFPPNYNTVKIDPITGKETERSRTNRPAEVFKIPASHCLTLYDCESDHQSNRLGLAGFVIQFVASLLGVKLQFRDWWMVGRVPVSASTVNIYITKYNVETFIRKAIDAWKQLDVADRKRITNLLYVYSEAGTREWDWECFQLEYMVADACYKIADNQQQLSRGRRVAHSARFQLLAEKYGLKQHPFWFDLFPRLRNDLFHECLWDGGQIFAAPTSESGAAPFHLHRFNHRLIVALLGIETTYIGTDWLNDGTWPIEIDP